MSNSSWMGLTFEQLRNAHEQLLKDHAELQERCRAQQPQWLGTAEDFAVRLSHAGWRPVGDAQYRGLQLMFEEARAGQV